MNRRRIVVAALSTAIIAAVPWQAGGLAQTADNGPGAFVTRLGNQTIGHLSDPAASREAREGQLRELLREGFAVKRIGYFVLGKYRRRAPPETVAAFVDVFEDYIVTFYASQFTRYSGETFTVQKVLKTSRPKDSMVVTKILPTDGREPLRVDFQVRKLADSFKILDVRVEGVSMVLAQRDEFTTYIGNNGGKVDALINGLRQRLTKIANQDAK